MYVYSACSIKIRLSFLDIIQGDPKWRGFDDPEWHDHDDVGNHNYIGYHHDEDRPRFRHFPSSSFNKVSSGFGDFDFSRWADIKPFSSKEPSFAKEAPQFGFRDSPVGFSPDYDFDEPPVELGELHPDYDVVFGRPPAVALADLNPDYDFGGDIAPDYDDLVGGGGEGHGGDGFADLDTMTFGDILITTAKPPVIIVVNDTRAAPQNFKQLLTDGYGAPQANLVTADSYKAPKKHKDAYTAPAEPYKAPKDSYKAPDDSYNVVADDIMKAPGKHAAKMPGAAAKPLPLRKPIKASALSGI